MLIKDFPFLDHTTQKNKYVVVLNKDNSSEPVIYILPTSKTEKYKELRKKHHYFIIKANESKCFPIDTVLDFNQVKSMTFEDLENLYNTNKTSVIGYLEKNIILKIDTYIDKCKTLSDEFKRIITEK